MQAPRTHDATLVLRVWREPHDAVIRGRLTWVAREREVTALGAEDILTAVADALRLFTEEADATA